jgi:hypothetical protein
MQLSRMGRIVTFTAAVLVLVGLGVFLFLPNSSAAGSKHPTPPSHSVAPLASQPTASTGTAKIYQWLPFTQSGLSTAVAVTTAFGKAYGTYTYSESTSAYLAAMKHLASSELLGAIGRAFSAPGLAATRTSSRQDAAGSASIVSLRAFGTSSITFVVAITEQITQPSGHHNRSTDYAITVVGTASSWQVSDIELASAGNQ